MNKQTQDREWNKLSTEDKEFQMKFYLKMLQYPDETYWNKEIIKVEEKFGKHNLIPW